MRIICNRNENIDVLIPYIDKPVYVKGFCWNKSFDGWTVIYNGSTGLMFDYRGKTYSVYGFLPSRFTMWCDSTYENAIYKSEVL